MCLNYVYDDDDEEYEIPTDDADDDIDYLDEEDSIDDNETSKE